jgi:glycosyltransferase involved in cell wall biosynthesis
VITGNISAMPETAGDAALLVDPHSPEDIAAAMRKSLNVDLHNRLRLAGLEHARQFTWEAAAQQVLEHYARVAKS